MRSTKAWFPVITLVVFLIFSFLAVRGGIRPGHILYGEFIDTTNIRPLWNYVLYPWSDYLSLGHTTLGFPNASSNISGQIFGSFFSGGHIYWLSLGTLLQFAFGSYSAIVYIGLSVLLPFVGMYILASYVARLYKYPFLYPLTASLLYGLGPQIVMRLQTGSIRYSLAYGLFPLVFLFLHRTVKSFTWRSLVLGSLVLLLISFLQIHFVLMYAVVSCVVALLLRHKPKSLVRFLTINLFWATVVIIANLHIWLPPLIFRETSLIPENSFFTGATIANGLGTSITKLAATVAGKPDFSRDYYFQLLQTETVYALILFSISTLAVVLKPNAINKISFGTLCIAVLLGAGTHFPVLGKLVGWLYFYITPLHAFRDTTKFVALILLAYSLLIPSVISLKNKYSFRLLVVVTFLIANSSKAFFTGDLDGRIKTFHIPQEYFDVQKSISGRILYLAAKRIVQGAKDYSWYPVVTSPSVMSTPFDFLVPWENSTLSKAGSGESYSTRFMSHIEPQCGQAYFATILEKTATNWIVRDKNITPETLASKSECQTELATPKVQSFGNLDVYRLPPTSEIARTQNPILTFGNFQTFDFLGNHYPDLLSQSLIFLQQNKKQNLDSFFSLQGPLVIHNTSLTEAALTLAWPKVDSIKFDHVLNNPSDSRKYWVWDKGLANKQTVENGDLVFSNMPIYTNGPNSISTTFNLATADYYLVLVHALVGPDKVGVDLNLDDKQTRFVNLKSTFNGLVWQVAFIEELSRGKHKIKLQANDSSPVFIDQVVVVSSNDLNAAKVKLTTILASRSVVAYYSPELMATLPADDMLTSRGTVGPLEPLQHLQYSKNSPTNIDVISTDSKPEPSLVVFRQSFSSFWRLNGQSPVIVDGFANGFIINSRSPLQLTYLPSRLYSICLGVSQALTLGLIVWSTLLLVSKNTRQPA